jgi:hypothetical protein
VDSGQFLDENLNGVLKANKTGRGRGLFSGAYLTIGYNLFYRAKTANLKSKRKIDVARQ